MTWGQPTRINCCRHPGLQLGTQHWEKLWRDDLEHFLKQEHLKKGWCKTVPKSSRPFSSGPAPRPLQATRFYSQMLYQLSYSRNDMRAASGLPALCRQRYGQANCTGDSVCGGGRRLEGWQNNPATRVYSQMIAGMTWHEGSLQASISAGILDISRELNNEKMVPGWLRAFFETRTSQQRLVQNCA